MIKALIDLSLKNRFLVFLATAFILAAGIFTLTRLPLDAIPVYSPGDRVADENRIAILRRELRRRIIRSSGNSR